MSNRRIEDLFRTCMVIAQLNLLDNALESESKWSNDLIHMAKLIDEDEYWWDYPINRMNMAQRRSLKMVLLELQKLIAQRLDRLEGSSTQTQP
ncbi:agamous MADS-box protein AGL62 [Trifolium repens]|nr:agamous MADS-box protein AGL62 [Trifolium repens]